MSHVCGTCNRPAVQLSWDQLTTWDKASLIRMGQPSKHPYLKMASIGWQCFKFAATRYELSKVYECKICKRRWRVWLE